MVIGIKPRHRRLKRIDAWTQIAHHAVQRQKGGHVAVDLHRDGAAAFPHLLGDLGFQVVAGPLIQRAAEIVGLDGADQIAVGDAQKGEIERLGIHRADRNPALPYARQDIGATGEADFRATVADILGDGDVLLQHLAIGGGQALPEGQRVALAMLHPADADLAARRLHR